MRNVAFLHMSNVKDRSLEFTHTEPVFTNDVRLDRTWGYS